MDASKLRSKFSLGIFFILIAISMVSISCDKSKDLIDTWAEGVVIDRKTSDPIPNAKVYLMKNSNPISVDFSFWDRVDSISTNENGFFRFDYQVPAISSEGYSVYSTKEHYFDYKEIQIYSRGEKEEGIRPSLAPKSYLQIKVRDEPPYSEYRSMHIPTLVSQNTIEISGNPIDTVVTRWLHADESELMSYFFHKQNGEWDEEAISISSCSSFDTCYLEILF